MRVNNFYLAFLIIEITYLMCIVYFPSSYDLNRTIGWGYDVTNLVVWLPILKLSSIILFAYGYYIVFTPNANLNILHLLLTILLVVLHFFHNYSKIDLYLILINWILFVINLKTGQLL